MKERNKKLDRVRELVQKTGWDVVEIHEEGLDEYILTVPGGPIPIREITELGLTVTDIHNTEITDPYPNPGKGFVDMHVSQKEGAKSVWYAPTREERLWIDCVIYQDLENDAAHCMFSGIPLLTSRPLIDDTVEYLKMLQGKGYTKFYQAVGYIGVFGKYDENNCLSTCLICKNGLLACSEERGDVPIPMIYVDGTIGIKTSPVVVYIICFKCYQNYYEPKREIPMGIIKKEINFMLHSEDTRWIKAHKIIKSPYSD